MAKLYLHAGTHKTGTTALQTFAVQNREQLLSQGLLYPDFSPLGLKQKDGHHQFAHSIAESNTARMTLEEVHSVIQHWHHQAEEHGADILISVEALYRHMIGNGSVHERRLAFLRRVADMLSVFDVEIILLFRRPDDFIRSLYQEHIASSKPRKTLPRIADWIRTLEPFHLDYFESAKIFREAFPSSRLFIYEDMAAGGNLYRNFFAELRVDTSELETPGRVRRSLTVPETVVRNYAGDFLNHKRAARQFNEWLKSPEISDRIAAAFGGNRFDLWQSHAERAGFLNSRSEDLKALRESFFPEREQLFPVLQESDTSPPVPELPKEIKRLVDAHIRDAVKTQRFLHSFSIRAIARSFRARN